MKKFLRNFAFAAAAAVGVVSCDVAFDDTDDIFATDEGAVTATLYASTPSQTKVSFTDNTETIDLAWEQGDEFEVYDDGVIVGTFTCADAELGKFTSADAELVEQSYYMAVYNKTVDLYNQNGDEIDDLDEACQMEATFTYGTDETIEFEHTMAVMTFSFESTTAPAKLVFENGSETYTVSYTSIEPVSGYYTSHIMINPCEGVERTLTFALYEADEVDAYDIRTVTTTKAYAAGCRYTSPVSSLDATFWVGSGTEADPYQISTAGHLRLLSTNVADGTTYSGEYFELMNSIDLEGSSDNPWTPIGTGEYTDVAFAGVFDGGGYSVTGLYIDASTTYQGLFGSVVSGTVKNLSVGGSVTVSSVGTCGIVAGYSKFATFISCTALSGSSVSGSANNVAGISGYVYNTTFTDCHNNASVSGTRYVGGIVGYCNDSTVASFTNCSNTGAIYSSSNNFAGGIVGKIFGSGSVVHTMTNCFNSGSVSSNGQYVGGLVGANQGGAIYNSYNIGEVSSTSDNVGGLVGIIESYTSSNITTYATMENCYSSAKVSGGSNVGLAVGKCDGATIASCYYDSSQSGEAIGVNSDNQCIAGCLTSFMQDELFTYILCNNAYSKSQSGTTTEVCKWAFVDGTYPTLDVKVAPTYTDLSQFVTSCTAYGSGTESAPYQIFTGAQLRDLASDVNGGTTYSGKYFEMICDIDLGGEDNEFTAIGKSRDYSLYGTFDGGLNEVSGLYINKSTSDYQGLFGFINESGVVKNLGVSGSVTGDQHVGGVVGCSYGNNTVNNCYNKATVAGYDNVGGVVGYNQRSTVSNCYNTGTVTGTATAGADGYIGGIVGISMTSSTVNNCYNAGAVTGDVNYLGGIVGWSMNNSTVSCCYNTGAVAGRSRVGGIVGCSNNTVLNYSYNTGTVTTTTVSGVSYCGGIVGHNNSTVAYCIYDSSIFEGDAIGYDDSANTNNSGSATLKATMTNGSFASTLGTDSWKEDNSTQINSGYPILIWQ